MRLTCLTAALWLVASSVCAQQSKSPPGVCEKEAKEGFVCLFDGKTLGGWQGAVDGHVVEKGVLVCTKHGGGNLFTKKEYSDFIFRFEYKLEPGGNNGVGIRAPLEGTPAFAAIEIQILDNSAPEWKDLDPVQLNGTVYGVVAAKQGHEKPPGQWNAMEIMAKGPHVKVTLNGTVIVDTDLRKAKPTPFRGDSIEGLRREKGYIGFCGHGHRVEFRNIRIKDLRNRPEKTQ